MPIDRAKMKLRITTEEGTCLRCGLCLLPLRCFACCACFALLGVLLGVLALFCIYLLCLACLPCLLPLLPLPYIFLLWLCFLLLPYVLSYILRLAYFPSFTYLPAAYLPYIFPTFTICLKVFHTVSTSFTSTFA